MNSGSFVDQAADDSYLPTERGDDDERHLTSPSKNDDSICDESMYQENPNWEDSMTSDRGLTDSPGGSPRRRSSQSKVRLTNDMGQIRLTLKMRDKEKELRKFLSVQRNRTLR